MRGLDRPRGAIGAAAVIFLVGFGMALARSATTAAGPQQTTVDRLEQDLQEQKTIIAGLIRRLRALERDNARDDGPEQPRAVKRGPASRVGRPSQAKVHHVAAPGPTDPSRVQIAQAPLPANRDPPAIPSAPGQLLVSEDDAERALERTLIATGNLLVPYGFVEVEPQFGYARREVPSSVLFNLNRDEFNFALSTRVGLPWESQLELSLPYNIAEQQVTDVFVSPAQQLSKRRGSSFGDLTVGLAKTFVHENGWVPDVLGRVTYEAPTGPQRNDQVPLPSGRNAISFAATALKRQDPLVLVATAGYTKAFESGGLNPGDQINVQLGGFLATSPETTLRGVLQQNFLDDITIHNIRIPGSGGVQSTLTLGGSSILYRGVLLDLQVGIGLTNAAPKYSVILSSTYRFGMR